MAFAISDKNEPLMWLGCVVLILTAALLGGVISVARKLSRGEGNRKCQFSFLCFALGWILYFAVAAIAYQSRRPILGTIVAMAIFAGFGLAAVSLAIVGLGELRRSSDL